MDRLVHIYLFMYTLDLKSAAVDRSRRSRKIPDRVTTLGLLPEIETYQQQNSDLGLGGRKRPLHCMWEGSQFLEQSVAKIMKNLNDFGIQVLCVLFGTGNFQSSTFWFEKLVRGSSSTFLNWKVAKFSSQFKTQKLFLEFMTLSEFHSWDSSRLAHPARHTPRWCSTRLVHPHLTTFWSAKSAFFNLESVINPRH